jgi:hypothetical protein
MKQGLPRLRKKSVQAIRRMATPFALVQWHIYRGLWPARRPWEPTFFIIGPPRCGTTWLKTHLAMHPNILMASGEPEYFSNYFHLGPLWYARRLSQAMFRERKRPGDIVHIGEKSARYCALPTERIRLVDRLFPHARYLLMSRDPAARIWSAAKMHLKKRGEAVTQRRVLKFADRLGHRFDEHTARERWADVVGDRLLVLPLEAIMTDPLGQYRRALLHIGLQESVPADVEESLAQAAAQPRPYDVPAYLADYLRHGSSTESAELC